jgi:predicted chitinase
MLDVKRLFCAENLTYSINELASQFLNKILNKQSTMELIADTDY